MAKFKPVFLYEDEQIKRILLNTYESKRNALNGVKKECELVLNRELSEEELNALMQSATGFVKNLKENIKAKFLFSSASTHFNLQAMGIDYSMLDDSLKNVIPEKLLYDIDGEFKPNEKEIIRLKKNSLVYTKNAKQNEVVAELKKIADAYNTLIEIAVIPEHIRHFTRKGTNQYLTISNGNLVLNNARILQLN